MPRLRPPHGPPPWTDGAAPRPAPPEQASYPARGGNALAVHIDGVAFYARLYRALCEAKEAFWGVVSFIHRDFAFPNGVGFWDAMDAAQARGVDVRLLFWRNPAFRLGAGNVFGGDPADLAFLARRGTRWGARWDSSGDDPAHCHHQKVWVVDPGAAGEVAFVGGMTVGKTTVDDGRHLRPRSRHDVFAEVRGPACWDVIHNVAQRWNQAGRDAASPAPWPHDAPPGLLSVPARPGPDRGDAVVQLGRTLAPERYGVGRVSVPGSGLDPWGGESSVKRQYLEALGAARETIYLENQHPGELAVLEALDAALHRGVRVVYVVPGEPMAAIGRARRAADAWYAGGMQGEAPRYAETFERFEVLGRHPEFTLAALAVSSEEAPLGAEVYVHAKVAVVDGCWATVGSANLVDLSLNADHTELNLTFWHTPTACALLRRLADEHLDAPLKRSATDRDALKRLASCAEANADRRAREEPMRGHIYALHPESYGREVVR